ncbi:MerR family transcriptional regulator [Phaeovulum vinaykumarii]|uniref:MerR HTH family regulatory protein n=1 Tax=Phaeovulum vinaykumarii TaxID=407234 RepID=A0A1N7JPK3_9RHOB|nr:MerR family transcriptional regulator [Phaeovulum vinaykumarii]SIS51293.1 MerR HTH family regulatory protein [Phaeovulum vinaykumarii]SOB90670.1 MerR-like DNA binding protein [Phaeovulum vinaykumarii]
MPKAADAFRTISEVAEALNTPAHVLRFWESRFTQVRPVKRAGGRRYYRPGDILLLAAIKRLLHEQGLTIRGVQKILREQGIQAVIDAAGLTGEDILAADPSHGGAAVPPRGRRAVRARPEPSEDAPAPDAPGPAAGAPKSAPPETGAPAQPTPPPQGDPAPSDAPADAASSGAEGDAEEPAQLDLFGDAAAAPAAPTWPAGPGTMGPRTLAPGSVEQGVAGLDIPDTAAVMQALARAESAAPAEGVGDLPAEEAMVQDTSPPDTAAVPADAVFARGAEDPAPGADSDAVPGMDHLPSPALAGAAAEPDPAARIEATVADGALAEEDLAGDALAGEKLEREDGSEAALDAGDAAPDAIATEGAEAPPDAPSPEAPSPAPDAHDRPRRRAPLPAPPSRALGIRLRLAQEPPIAAANRPGIEAAMRRLRLLSRHLELGEG